MAGANRGRQDAGRSLQGNYQGQNQRGGAPRQRGLGQEGILLRCPRSTVPEAMRACKFSDKESKDAGKQMAVHRADSNTTINQQSNQQKWAVAMAAIVTATAAVTTATRRRDGNATTQQPTNEGISKRGR